MILMKILMIRTVNEAFHDDIDEDDGCNDDYDYTFIILLMII